MKKLLFLLLVAGACVLYFSGKQAAVDTRARLSEEKGEITLPESVNAEYLQKVLPASVYKKLVRPFLEKSSSMGLTREERDSFLDELEKIGDALGGKAKSSVAEVIDSIDPERKSKGVGAQIKNWMGEKAGEARESMPSWRGVLLGTLQTMERGLVFLLNKAADFLEGK